MSNPISQYESWILSMTDEAIDEDQSLIYTYNGTEYNPGWNAEYRAYLPQGGCGQWPSVALFYLLAEKYPDKAADYTKYANSIIDGQLAPYLDENFEKKLMGLCRDAGLNFGAVHGKGKWQDGFGKINPAKVQPLLDLLVKIMPHRVEHKSSAANAESDGYEYYYNYFLSFPVLIEGVKYYSGEHAEHIRRRCMRIMGLICLAACELIIWVASEISPMTLDTLSAILKETIDYDLLVCGAEVARYSLILGDYFEERSGRLTYQRLGAHVAQITYSWYYAKGIKTDSIWAFAQLAEACGLACQTGSISGDERENMKQVIIGDLLNYYKRHYLTLTVDNSTVDIGFYSNIKIYDHVEYVEPMTSVEYLIHLATSSWYELLVNGSDTDKQNAEEMIRQYQRCMNYMKNVVLNSTEGMHVLDHDVRYDLQRSGDTTNYIYAGKNGYGVGYNNCCIQCSFATIYGWHRLNAVLEKTGS